MYTTDDKPTRRRARERYNYMIFVIIAFGLIIIWLYKGYMRKNNSGNTILRRAKGPLKGERFFIHVPDVTYLTK